ncbi:hypothetical protein [Desulfobacter sp.]|uniref:hypothetical protein n=1 Tax=Desulfobacter sp. TaxID=2294 RepID=UPI003D0B4E4B
MLETRRRKRFSPEVIARMKDNNNAIIECPAGCAGIVLPLGASLPHDIPLFLNGENGKIHTGRKLRITKKGTIQTI